ncbi:MAG: LCP family protein [Candidatus Levybacteria bacterium]|nr:LCP family protein [Candidatus Levybacteria bacterium]
MPTRKNRQIGKFLKLLLLLILIGVVLKILLLVITYAPVAYQLAFDKKISLKKVADERINVLLLGIGGGNHDGPNLTDTIIFTSIDPKNKKITMITLPRDLWIQDLNSKINKAYSDGQENGKGLVLAKAAVGKVLGQKIDYGFRIDFNGFTKAVDMMGGLDVTVERAFDDYAYPLSGKEDDLCGYEEIAIASFSAQIATGSATDADIFPCRFEHLHFDKGLLHMNGETALKYVRSRHALGPEGSDFARSKRQEKVISAFKEKVFSAGTLLNPLKLVSLFDTFQSSIDTDIKKDEYDDFVKLANKMRGAITKNYVIDTGDEEADRPALLYNPPLTPDRFGGAWVLIPKKGESNYSEIQNYVKCLVENSGCLATPTPISKK